MDTTKRICTLLNAVRRLAIALFAFTVTPAAIANDGIPGIRSIDAPAITPAAAQRIFAAGALPARRSAAAAAAATEGAPEIAALARALRNDVDLIYEYVHDEIRFEPSFGLKKGALGTLLDKSGNSFDQSALMIALLREAGYTAGFVYGTIRLTTAQLDQWLGVEADRTTIRNLLARAGIPLKFSDAADGSLRAVDFNHVWVRVAIDGTDYIFDPSFKRHSHLPPTDVKAAMGYDPDMFLSLALSGATVNTDLVQNLNRANIHGALNAYTINLSNNLDASAHLDEVIGGSRIIPVANTLRQTRVPYPHVVLEEWPVEVPASLRATLRVRLPGIDQSFDASDIYGRRLTVFYDTANRPVLRLDGVALATGSAAAPGTTQTITVDVNQAYLASNGTLADQSGTQGIAAGGTYVLANAWGNTGRGLVEHHRRRLNAARAAGETDDSEPVLGETLALIAANYLAQLSQGVDLSGRLADAVSIRHHLVGVAGSNESPYIDLPFVRVSNISLSAQPPVAERAAFFAYGSFASALEHAVIEQTQAMEAVSTVELLDLANRRAEPIYDATSANFAAIRGQLSGYSAGDLNRAQAIVDAGGRVLLPRSGNLGEHEWSGAGFIGITAEESTLSFTIGGGLKGGFGYWQRELLYTPTVQAAAPPELSAAAPQSADPIDMVTGDFLFENDDLTVGSGPVPLGLGFQRSYNSAARFADGPLGRGWSHNFAITASRDSNGYQGLGEDSPIDAAAAIAAMTVSLDLLDGPRTKERVLVAALIQRWLTDNLTDNMVVIEQPGNTQHYRRLPDGRFHPPPGVAATLTETAGQFKLVTKDGITLDFDTDGRLSTRTDPNGNALRLTYSGENLSTVSNPFGRTLTLSYAGNRVSGVSDGTGRSIGYAYDATGNLTRFTNAASEATTFAYDQPGRLTQVFLPQNPTAPIVTNAYDALDRVQSQTNAIGGVSQYYFAGHRSEEVDPLGNARTWYYDEHGKPVETIDALGNVTTVRYDGEQRVIARTFPEGNGETYSYDERHNVLTAVATAKPGTGLPLIVQRFSYEPTFNRTKTTTDGLGRVTTFDYDTKGNVVRTVLPAVDGVTPAITYTYDARGQRLTETDAEGRVTRYAYDATTGNLLSVTVDDGGLALTTRLGYDAAGNATTQTDPQGRVVVSAYDSERRLTQVTAPGPFRYLTRFTYDRNGQLTQTRRETRDPANPWQTTSVSYTLSGQRETVTDPQGDVSRFAYDRADRLTQATDGDGRVTKLAYDAAGRLLRRVQSVNSSDITLETYAYTANGQRRTVRSGATGITTFGYDGHDRLIRVTYPDARLEAFTYDAAGNVLTRRNRAGQTATYTYDSLDRRRTKAVPGTATARYSYDLTGLRTALTDATGTVRYGYDTAGRVNSVTDANSRRVEYGYDAAGNRTRLTYPDGYVVTQTYDALDRLSEVRENGTALIARYAYDALSRATRVDYGNGASSTWSYEIDNDLAALEHTLGAERALFEYAYNRTGQRIDETLPEAYLWRPTGNITVGYTSNALNQYTVVDEAPITYDANGNLTDDGFYGFRYDAENRLIEASAPPQIIEYVYDADGRRLSKSVDGDETHFVYDGGRVIAEYDDAGALQSRYVYGAGLDEVLVLDTGAERLYYHADGQGSVVALSGPAGGVVERYAYGPFGESRDASAVTNPYRYTGRRFEPETELYYYRARFYHPGLGRFLQPDPVGFGDGLNLYAYVRNDPLNLIDPLGLAAQQGLGSTALNVGVSIGTSLIPYSDAVRNAANGDWGGAIRSAAIETGAAVAGAFSLGFAYGAYKAFRVVRTGALVVDDVARAVPNAGLRSVGAAVNRTVTFSERQLTRKFKHAGDFGVVGNNNSANRTLFRETLERHVSDDATRVIPGTFRNQDATLFFNANTNNVVIRNADDEFLSGFRLNAQQIENVVTRGALGGG